MSRSEESRNREQRKPILHRTFAPPPGFLSDPKKHESGNGHPFLKLDRSFNPVSSNAAVYAAS
jgi:hypothetical protein